MAYILGFGSAIPDRAVTNQDLANRLSRTPDWIRNVSGIEERRHVCGQSLVDLAAEAGKDALEKTGLAASDIGMLLVATGTGDRPFPGPACQVAARIGLSDVPAVDVPMASAGSIFGLALAAELTSAYGAVLLIGAEVMSRVVMKEPLDPSVSILFGDGAGACILHPSKGTAKVIGSILASDGAYAEDLKLEEGTLSMNGRSVILQASRKIPRVITQLLERYGLVAAGIETFLMHQANQNLMDRVADALGVARDRFYSNIRRYGNTSSASMLIAAEEWSRTRGFEPGGYVCFTAFGAGFHWGAVLAQGL